MSTGEHDLDLSTSTAETTEGAEGEATPKKKLELDVEITDVGPCKKHLKVSISRTEIDRQFDSLADDADYRRLNEELAGAFAASDWEALLTGESER